MGPQASEQPGAQRRGSELKIVSPASRGVAGVDVGRAPDLNPSPRQARWREERGWQAPGPGFGTARGLASSRLQSSASVCGLSCRAHRDAPAGAAPTRTFRASSCAEHAVGCAARSGLHECRCVSSRVRTATAARQRRAAAMASCRVGSRFCTRARTFSHCVLPELLAP